MFKVYMPICAMEPADSRFSMCKVGDYLVVHVIVLPVSASIDFPT